MAEAIKHRLTHYASHRHIRMAVIRDGDETFFRARGKFGPVIEKMAIGDARKFARAILELIDSDG